MVQIIHPTFVRNWRQKKRLLKAKPSLRNHPEFEEPREPMALPLLIALGGLFLLFTRKTHP